MLTRGCELNSNVQVPRLWLRSCLHPILFTPCVPWVTLSNACPKQLLPLCPGPQWTQQAECLNLYSPALPQHPSEHKMGFTYQMQGLAPVNQCPVLCFLPVPPCSWFMYLPYATAPPYGCLWDNQAQPTWRLCWPHIVHGLCRNVTVTVWPHRTHACLL
jgi:hypothetical protein